MAKSKKSPGSALARELAEARAFQAATADILRLVKRSAADPQQIFDEIVETCHRLFAPDNAGLRLLRDDGQVQFVAHCGDLYSSHRDLPTVAPLATTATGLAMQRGETLHYPEVNEIGRAHV